MKAVRRAFCALVLSCALGASTSWAAFVQFVGNGSYSSVGNVVALTADQVANLSASGFSGTLRLELWVFPAQYNGDPIAGYKLAEYSLGQLTAGFSYFNVNSGPIPFVLPPDGVWYFVLQVTEFTASPLNDGYTVDDWINFLPPVVIGPPSQITVAVEYYYALWNFYFLTADPNEIAFLDNGGFNGVWQRTGQEFNVHPLAAAPASSSTVYRFFSTIFSPKSAHFYTANVAEYNALVNGIGWQLEGPVFSTPMPASDGTCPAGSIPIYRMYNNGMGGAPNHRFTTDINVRAAMLAAGWIPEGQGIGVGFCSPQ